MDRLWLVNWDTTFKSPRLLVWFVFSSVYLFGTNCKRVTRVLSVVCDVSITNGHSTSFAIDLLKSLTAFKIYSACKLHVESRFFLPASQVCKKTTKKHFTNRYGERTSLLFAFFLCFTSSLPILLPKLAVLSLRKLILHPLTE